MTAEAGICRQLDVVVATNRRSPFLDEALASVVGQVAVRCNIVLVDDGSDAPGDLRRSISNVPNACYVRQEAAGLSAARNRGLREGSGEFVAFLDDDDVWHPDKSSHQLAAISAHPGAVICGCDGWYIDAAGTRLGSWHPVGDHASAEYLAGTAPLPRIVTLISRRVTCESVGGFDVSLRMSEDLEYTLRMLLNGDCVTVAEPLVYYRQHQSNMSQTQSAQVESRLAMSGAYQKLIDACASEGRSTEAELLRQNYANRQREWFLSSLRELNAARRSHSVSGMVREARWLMAHSTWLPQAVPTVVKHLRNRRST